MRETLDDIKNYNKNRDKKVLIVFDDMISDIEYNKDFKKIIKELFYRGRLNIRLNSTHYILIKISNKKELKKQQKKN